MTAPIWLTILILSAFVGIEVVAKISSTLHPTLRSLATAIHGIILVGAIVITGTSDDTFAVIVGFVAIVLATVNLVGGFLATDRMLRTPKAGVDQ